MSYCGACSKCVREKDLTEQPKVLNLVPHSGTPAGKTPKAKDEIKELEEMVEELKRIRREARQLMRSGHPGVAQEGLNALRQAEDSIRWVTARLSKEVTDA